MRVTQERSQQANRAIALARLRAKLLAVMEDQRAAELAELRGDLVKAEWGQQVCKGGEEGVACARVWPVGGVSLAPGARATGCMHVGNRAQAADACATLPRRLAPSPDPQLRAAPLQVSPPCPRVGPSSPRAALYRPPSPPTRAPTRARDASSRTPPCRPRPRTTQAGQGHAHGPRDGRRGGRARRRTRPLHHCLPAARGPSSGRAAACGRTLRPGSLVNAGMAERTLLQRSGCSRA